MKISLIGAGNVAANLGVALTKAGHQIVEVYSRSFSSALMLTLKLSKGYATDEISALSPADLYIVAVSDHAIKEVLKKFPYKNKPIVHTSGSVSINVFGKSFTNAGVLYPVQTFSKERKINFDKVPLLIEAKNAKTLALINRLASSVSFSVREMNSENRRTVHFAAVITNNFSNHLYEMAEKVLKKKDIPFSILAPLLQETVKKAVAIGPGNAQTGPAKRGEVEIIEGHLKMLGAEKRLKQIYRLLSESIRETDAARL